jgi:hypothetical protein
MMAAVANAPSDALERFRATGIAIVRFAVAHPEHFRALSVPGLLERVPLDQRAKRLAWQDAEAQLLYEAQQRGEIVDLPLLDVLLAANATMQGLAHMIIEGSLGPIDDARAVELAIAVTQVLGVGLLPRPLPGKGSR